MTQVWRMDLQTSDKMVLLALADAANDEGVTWLAVCSRKEGKLDLLKKTSLSERTIQASIKRLCEAGHLSRCEKPGRGVIYTVTPANTAPPQPLRPANEAPTPATTAGKPSVTIIPVSNETVGARQKRVQTFRFVPESWMPSPKHGETAASEGMTAEQMAYQATRFREHEFKKPITNVDLAFHRWIRTSKDFGNGNARTDARVESRQQNYRDSWAGADGASALLAARRNL